MLMMHWSYIDAKTMEIHHSKHHQAYITRDNAALEGTSFENTSIDELCRTCLIF